MAEASAAELRAPALGQLLLMQSVLCGLPDERSIYSFVCRGLGALPGVEAARHEPAGASGPAPNTARFPLVVGASNRGELVLTLADPAAFAPYVPYLQNFAVMVALILEERRQRAANQRHQEELEQRVQERTLALREENAERRRVEEELRRERNMLAHTLDSVPQAIFWKDRHGRYQGCNRVFALAAGLASPEAVEGLTEAELPWAEQAARIREEDREIMEKRQPRRRRADELRQAGGAMVPIEITKVPLFDAAGDVYGLLGVFEDISDRRRAETEREQLRAQLVQAQKMESVGRLAGGVAHDFNNMLQAIMGNASLAAATVPAGSTLREHLDEILKAAERSAGLTHQLLAFARKQTASPKVLDLNATVTSMLKMLRRLIGEDTQLAWTPGAGLWPVKIDPVQIDQILANIVVNARDAVRGGGRISIETANQTVTAAPVAEVPPGDYVRLAIADTGTGMTAETLSHLFEPFYTTKQPGEGTGLGLATVYGIVKQNNGAITVQSAPGRGSTFTVYFPRAEPATEPVSEETPRRPAGGTETVLLVEDEEQILTLAQRVLQQQGYHVLAAAHPSVALRLAERCPGPIHLLITDVIMPGMNGRELLGRVAALKPGVRCLFISGYTSDVIARQGVIEDGIQFQPKPFTAADLMSRVRQVLDGRT